MEIEGFGGRCLRCGAIWWRWTSWVIRWSFVEKKAPLTNYRWLSRRRWTREGRARWMKRWTNRESRKRAKENGRGEEGIGSRTLSCTHTFVNTSPAESSDLARPLWSSRHSTFYRTVAYDWKSLYVNSPRDSVYSSLPITSGPLQSTRPGHLRTRHFVLLIQHACLIFLSGRFRAFGKKKKTWTIGFWRQHCLIYYFKTLSFLIKVDNERFYGNATLPLSFFLREICEQHYRW